MHPDHHAVVKRHYYSTPFQLVHKQLEVRQTASCVELLIQAILDQLYKLRLNGMAEAFRKQLEDPHVSELSCEYCFGLLVDSQYVWKEESRALTRRLSLAKLRVQAPLEDIDFRHSRGLGRARWLSLANESRCVQAKQNFLLGGYQEAVWVGAGEPLGCQ